MATKEERREFPRIQITLEVRVTGPGGVAYGKLRDLSKGNASFFLSENVGVPGDTLDIFLPLSERDEIAVMGELTRVDETPQGRLHALRFTLVEPSLRKRLFLFIENALHRRGSETRKYPRIAYHVPVTYSAGAKGKAMLETIALGGLGITADREFVMREDVAVNLPWPKTTGVVHLPLSVRGVVVSQFPLEDGDRRMWRIGVQFKNPTTELLKAVDAYIRAVLDLNTPPV